MNIPNDPPTTTSNSTVAGLLERAKTWVQHTIHGHGDIVTELVQHLHDLEASTEARIAALEGQLAALVAKAEPVAEKVAGDVAAATETHTG